MEWGLRSLLILRVHLAPEVASKNLGGLVHLTALGCFCLFQILEFIQRCTAHMQATLQNYSFDFLRKVDSPRALVCTPSKFGGISQGLVNALD